MLYKHLKKQNKRKEDNQNKKNKDFPFRSTIIHFQSLILSSLTSLQPSYLSYQYNLIIIIHYNHHQFSNYYNLDYNNYQRSGQTLFMF